MRCRRSVIFVLPAIYAIALAAVPAAAPIPPIEIPDEVLAVAPLPDGPAALAVLGRRTLTLLDRDGDGWKVRSRDDLTPFVPATAKLPRLAAGYVDPAGPPSGPGEVPPLRVRSSALGTDAPLQLAWEGGVLRRLPSPGGSTAASDAAPEGPGRTLDLQPRQGPRLRFDVDSSGRLVAAPPGGVPLAIGPAAGDVLAVLPGDAGRSGEALVYTSAASLPGEADRVLEFRWTGHEFHAERHSVDLPARVAAFAPISAGRDRVVVAIVDGTDHSRIETYPVDSFWEEEQR